MSRLALLLIVACSAAPEPLPDPRGPYCYVRDPFGKEGPSVAFYAPDCQGRNGAECPTSYGLGVCTDTGLVQ